MADARISSMGRQSSNDRSAFSRAARDGLKFRAGTRKAAKARSHKWERRSFRQTSVHKLLAQF